MVKNIKKLKKKRFNCFYNKTPIVLMATANEGNNAQFMGATIVAKMTNVKNDDKKQRRVNKNKADTTEWKTSIYVPPSGIKTQANDTFLCCNGNASENHNIHIVCTEDHANERAFTTWQQVLVHRGHIDEMGVITPLRSDKCPLCPSILAGQLSTKKKHLKEAHLDHARVLCKLPDGTDEEVIDALYSLPKIFINETGYCVPEERLRECKFSQCRLVDDSDHCSKFSHCDQTPVTKRECKFSPCRDMDKPEHCAKFLHDTVGHEPSLHQEKQSKKGYNSSPTPSKVEAHCKISATDTECWSIVGETLNKMSTIVEETDILIQCKYSPCREIDNTEHCKKFSHTNPILRCCKFSPCRDMDKPEHCEKFSHKNYFPPPIVNKNSTKATATTFPAKISTTWNKIPTTVTIPVTELWTTVGQTETCTLIQCKYSPCREIDNTEHCSKYSHTNPILRCCKFSPCRDMDKPEHCEKFSHNNSSPPPIVNKNSAKSQTAPVLTATTPTTCHTQIFKTWNKIPTTTTIPIIPVIDNSDKFSRKNPSPPISITTITPTQKDLSTTVSAAINSTSVGHQFPTGTTIESKHPHPNQIAKKYKEHKAWNKDNKAVIMKSILHILESILEPIKEEEDIPDARSTIKLDPNVMYATDHNDNKYPIKVPFDYELEENCITPSCNCGKNHVDPSKYVNILKKGTFMPSNMCWNEQPKTKKRCFNSECCSDDDIPRLHLKNHFAFCVKERERKASEVVSK